MPTHLGTWLQHHHHHQQTQVGSSSKLYRSFTRHNEVNTEIAASIASPGRQDVSGKVMATFSTCSQLSSTPSKWFKDFRGQLPRESFVSPGLVVRPSIHQRHKRPELNSPDSRILTRNAETGELVVSHDKADSNKTKAV